MKDIHGYNKLPSTKEISPVLGLVSIQLWILHPYISRWPFQFTSIHLLDSKAWWMEYVHVKYLSPWSSSTTWFLVLLTSFHMVSKLRSQHPSFISIVWLLHSVCLLFLHHAMYIIMGLAYDLTRERGDGMGWDGEMGRRKWGSHWWHSNDGFFLRVMCPTTQFLQTASDGHFPKVKRHS
jgi:hypothetical protein